MTQLTVETESLVGRLRPILEKADPQLLVRFVERHVAKGELVEALDNEDSSTVNVALACLAGVGTQEHAPAIARKLRSSDGMSVKLAEHALWSIWFRAGDHRANSDLRFIAAMINEGRIEDASAALDDLARRYPDYAEVYDQRAIAAFLRGDYTSAAADFRRTLRLNPLHFGALAGLANSAAMRGRLRQALRIYKRLRRIYPTMEGLSDSIRQIRRRLAISPHPDSFPSRFS